ncbi:MAG: AAA family ATPase [Pseudomonadota bacterium]
MYNRFFGLKERPFQLVPNPAYLFLGKSHEEAMAHLTYAIAQGDGFVEITGEVGTGKTTLCRAFLENLDEDTEAAYIFNPKLDAIQLLKAINDEFGISSDADNTKDLIDTLNVFLMKKKAGGEKVILLIDEAQNLSKEVLEQVRLLSNLETATSKLLQIILVGQPELGEMLDSPELRQLGQRISLSCYINPLSYKETRDYIQHRIHIASQRPEIRFTRAAFRAIYKYSGGIPRLINIACDRALLTAFGLNRKKITGSIARAAIRELAGRGEVKRYGLQERRNAVLLLFALCLALFLFIFYRPGDLGINHSLDRAPSQTQKRPKPNPQETKGSKPVEPARKPMDKKVAEGKRPEPLKEPRRDLGGYLATLKTASSRHTALKVALELWNGESRINAYLDNIDDDEGFFQLASKQNGLMIQRIKDDLTLVRRLNLPAILGFHIPGDRSPRYLTLTKIDNGKYIIRGEGDDGVIQTELGELRSYWSGVAYIVWKNFLNYTGIIPFNAPSDSLITLKMLIQDIGFSDIEVSPQYDEKTREAVKLIQERNGITVDGIVGPLTKIILYNEKKSLKKPHIISESPPKNIEEPTL